MPQPWEKYADTGSAGPWAKYSAPAEAPPPVPQAPTPAGLTGPPQHNVAGGILAAGNFAKDVGKGLGESAVSLMSTGNEAVRKIPGIGEWLTTPITGTPADKAIAHTNELAKPANTTQAVSKGIGQAAQFLIPGGAEEKAASLLPSAARGIGKVGLSALSSGLVNKAQGGDFTTGAIAGGGGSRLGKD